MYFIKMNDSNLLQIHLHRQFNKVVIDLLSVDIEVEENDKDFATHKLPKKVL